MGKNTGTEGVDWVMTVIERRVLDSRDLETLGSTLIPARLSQ